MAKTQIKNYVFKPGLGLADNLYPNAYSLIESNRQFILAEAAAYLQNIVNTYNQSPNLAITGVNPSASPTLSSEVTRISGSLTATNANLDTFLKSTASDGFQYGDLGADGSIGADDAALFNTLATTGDIDNKSALDRWFKIVIPGLLSDSNFSSYSQYFLTNTPPYTYDSSKCQRDIGYVLDAYLYDLRYGGNETLRNTIRYYWDGDIAQVDGDRSFEVLVHTFIGNLIQNYILTNVTYSAINVSQVQVIQPSLVAETNAITAIGAAVNATVAVIQNGLDSLPSLVENGVGSIKIQGSYDLNELLLITNTTKNEIIYNFTNNVTGAVISVKKDKITEDEDYPSFLQTTDGITTIKFNYNTSSHSPTDDIQIFVEKTENGKSVTTVRPFDFGSDAIERNRMAAPLSMLDADFEYGLQPTKWAAISTLRGYPSIYEIPGTDTPVISVTTDASFGNTTEIFPISMINSGTSDYTIQTGSDRLGALAGNDPVITIVEGDTISLTINSPNDANYNTYIKTSATHDAVTDLVPGVTGQGARNGNTVSWTTQLGDAGTYFYVAQGFGNMEGVITVVAGDADAGIGQSLITVETNGPHSLEPGDPFTIKALEDSVSGAARAEGSFVVVDTPTSSTFTYFAKAKVGTQPGTVLATTYTQLRKADFYTGASIGDPSFSVVSNGTSGTVTLELNVPSGSTILPFDGVSPEVGSPLGGNPAINPDAQVTGVLDTSDGGGEYLTVEVDGDYNSGISQFDVVDSSGVVAGLAIDRGDGTAIFVTNVVGNTIELSGNLTSPLVGNQSDYINVSGTNVATTGSEVSLTITNSSGTYSITSIQDGGTGYSVGDRLFVPGTSLGGLSPSNDLEILIDSVVSDGSLSTATIEGTGFSGSATISNLTPNVNGGDGAGQLFDIGFTNNVYSVALNASDASVDFIENDQIRVLGTAFSNGTSPTNDLLIKVTGVDGSGSITSVSFTGTAPDALVTYNNPAYSGGSGSGAQFNVTRTGTVYTVEVITGQEGINYVPTDTITILGSNLGGTSPANDLTITIDNVNGTGGITDLSVAGVAVNTDSETAIAGSVLVGIGLDISVNLSGGNYTVNSINSGGTYYASGQTFTVPGTSLIGTSPANDMTITVSTTNAAGTITGVTLSGVANNGSGVFTDIQPTNQQPIGSSATFDVTRDAGSYNVVLSTGGTGYKVGNKILIPGNQLGGVSPLNDLEIRVTGELAGSITTIDSSFIEASAGNIVRMYSTITMSEPLVSSLTRGAEVAYTELATIEITFDNAHGLVPGDSFIVTVGSDNTSNNHNLASGSFIASNIPALNKIRYQARADGTIDTTTAIDGSVYARPDSFFIHRPFDGGVQLGTGGPQHGAQAIRQSKKYIRYQSGKGIMYTTGALFAPSYDLRSVTSNGLEVGSTITVTTDDNDHGVQIGGVIRLLGIETPGYNSGPETVVPPEFDYEVINVIDERTFQIRAQRRLGSTEAVLGFGAQMSVVRWHGATVRSGIFDDQNGIFWEYDGTQISVVQRTGTRQLAGTIAVNVDSNLITGTNTRFRDQLKAGDRIIIRGMTHVVSHVNSQTEITVTPDWRGVVNISGAKANVIVDKKVKQSEFNLDRLDGTGPSGYNIDIAKMQMIGIQYSWYGAGFIDFMLRGQDGNFIFAHRMRNSNINTEAFMRSGNLPVRYEVTNEGPSGKLASDINSSQTTIPLVDSSFFPTSGTVYIDNEIISFTGNNKSTNTLTGCTRATSLSNYQAGAVRSYVAGAASAHSSRTGVVLISQTITPLISHWGSAFITDGGFDEDRGYIFSYAETGISVTTTRKTAFLIRLAPSVSNALVGDLGERELLNRAQLLLQSLEITSDTGAGGIVVEGILNPQNYPTNPNDVIWSGLSGLAQGGQPSFAQVAAGGGIDWGAAASTTVTATVQGAVDKTFPLYYAEEVDPPGPNNLFYVALEAGDEDWYMPNALYDDSGLEVGDIYVSDTGAGSFPAGTIIREIRRNIDGSGLTRFRMSADYSGGTIGSTPGGASEFGQDSGQTIVIRKNQTQASYVRTSFINYTQASFLTAIGQGVATGTPIAASDTSFPAGTLISDISARTFGLTGSKTTWYRVIYNRTSTGTINAGGTNTYELAQPAYAQPGETVFSFIAVPGERATVDFSQLKELTNTPLGGRGTYPNGPDVLAINVYKVSGAAINANIILNWGEAQA